MAIGAIGANAPSIAAQLAQARQYGRTLTAYPGPKPADQAAAYALQSEVTRALGWTACGYKVGCTSIRAQQALRTDHPFYAPLFRERCFETADFLPTAPNSMRVVEPEIAFVMRSALPARAQAYSVAEVLAAVHTVHAALEVVSPRVPEGLSSPLTWLIADGGVSDAFVLGAGVAALPEAAYAEISVEARVNSSHITRGLGANALGGAERVLVWLANELSRRGCALSAGEIVTTGLITEVFRCSPGDEVEAEFSHLGTVRARF